MGQPRVLVATTSFLMMLASGCGADARTGAGGGGGGGPADMGGGGVFPDLSGGTSTPPDLHFDPDAYWAQDPPLMYCYLDGGAFSAPKPPGGTPQCPDDKNREGCDCPKEGMTASCWPGLRANRGLGICMDGTTTCQKIGETSIGWGPCMGYVLPVDGATAGKDACKCFSAGQWKLDNLSPCFYDNGGGIGSGGVISSTLSGNMINCPNVMGQLMKPTMPWSNDTISADCAGHFKLCYALKAGNAMMPMMNDCTIVQVCVEADYTKVNMSQPFPPLPAFLANDNAAIACAEKFAKTGGYGEMSVTGETVTCDKFMRTFNRVNYCPFSCNQNPNDPMCKMCGNGGGGNF